MNIKNKIRKFTSIIKSEPENKVKPIIFYGITSKISEKINQYIAIAGKPVVFSTKDKELKDYKNNPLFNKYKVVSLDDAIKQYPDAEVWVLYKNPINTTKELLKKIAPEKIHFFEADWEYRKGCRFLGHFISYRKDNFSPCCITKQCPVVETSGSIQQRIKHWMEYTTKLVNDIRENKPNPCSKCPHLKYGFYPKTIKLDTLSFGTNQPGDTCNLRCVYCFSRKQLERLKDDKGKFTTYEILRQFSQMPEYNTPDFKIQLSNGEFCTNKYCDEIFDILLKMKWKVVFVTNMTVYREKFAEFLKTGRTVHVLTSIDAGTPETYKKIKGADCLNKVIANLKKYPLEKANLRLKYIFLEGLNDNETDIDGFYEIVKETGCKNIVLSSNLFKPFTQKMRDLTLRIVKKAKQDGIVISANSSYLNSKDAEFIKKSYENCVDDFIAQNEQQQKTEPDYDICDIYDTETPMLSDKNTNITINSEFSSVKQIKLEFADNKILTLSFSLISDDTPDGCTKDNS